MENEEVIAATDAPAVTTVATTEHVAEGDASVAAAAASVDAAIVSDIDELSQADAALATWMGELDEKTDRNAEELKGLRSWATEFQSSVSEVLGDLKGAVTELLSRQKTETVSAEKQETPEKPSESSASESKTETEAPKEAAKPEEAKVPLMDESAGARRKRISWI